MAGKSRDALRSVGCCYATEAYGLALYRGDGPDALDFGLITGQFFMNTMLRTSPDPC